MNFILRESEESLKSGYSRTFEPSVPEHSRTDQVSIKQEIHSEEESEVPRGSRRTEHPGRSERMEEEEDLSPSPAPAYIPAQGNRSRAESPESYHLSDGEDCSGYGGPRHCIVADEIISSPTSKARNFVEFEVFISVP